ncbi:helix-turn-helix domain-containing protein [Laribacter hongkongensis]|uniref:Transcriptional regulator n=1 Tax=Laribacter hongkongensis TaxID=168471 RepID=A0ABD4SUZ9_9NEIS|nr:transcriptional regulator [Laribacter hongkongensis]MCG9027057.1 transcriptional regulator [Laribacter hongkongensis]
MKSTTTIRPLFSAIANPRDIRRKLGMNQQAFWSCIGVTQSGGSRYESGRNMPKPVRELLRLVHVEGVDITAVRGEDVQIIAYLKDSHPDLYKSLSKAVQTTTAAGVAA